MAAQGTTFALSSATVDCVRIEPVRRLAAPEVTLMRLRPSRTTPILFLALAVFLLGIAPAITSAQTPYVPYFGKNRVKYDKFNWHIYESEHFEIYFYPEIEP